MIIGDKNQAYRHKARIVLLGDQRSKSSSFIYSDNIIAGNKLIFVAGLLEIYARPSYSNQHTSSLKAQANAGDTSIKVETNLGWKIGSKLVITTTDYDDTHSE